MRNPLVHIILAALICAGVITFCSAGPGYTMPVSGSAPASYTTIYKSSVTTSLAAAPSGSLLYLDAAETVTLPIAPTVGWYVDIEVSLNGNGSIIDAGTGTFPDLSFNQITPNGSPMWGRAVYLGLGNWAILGAASGWNAND